MLRLDGSMLIDMHILYATRSSSDFAAVLKRLQYELDQTGRCHNELAKWVHVCL